MSRNAPFQPTSTDLAVTPNFTAAPTSTGLAQGDMVFYNNGDHQPFSAQVSTTSFPLTVDQPLSYGVLGGTGGRLSSNLTSATPSGGNSQARNVAVLSNGNIVIASANTGAGGAYFTVYDTSFSVVVSRVTLPTTQYPATNTVGVTALAGGGFVIYFTNSSRYFCYAIYTNAGAVTTALTQETYAAINVNGSQYTVTSLSGGGFVVGGTNTSSQVFYMIYNASGTRTGGSTALASAAATRVGVIIVANNADTFFFMFAESTTTIRWYQINSSGTQLGGNAITTGGTKSNYFYYSATLLNDGVTIAVGYLIGTTGIGFRLYNSTSYSMGAQTQYPLSALLTALNDISSLHIQKLASGNIFVCMAGYQYINSFFTFLNPSLQALAASGQTSSTLVTKPLNPAIAMGNTGPYVSNCMNVVEVGSTMYVFYSTVQALGNGFMKYEVISSANYSQTPNNAITASAGSVTLPVGSYVPSTLTPASVSFYTPSDSTTVSAVTTVDVALTANVVDAGFGTRNYDVCTLSNGNFVIAYRNDTTTAVYARVYNSSGSLITTVTISSTSYNTNWRGMVKVKALASGKFVVTYPDTTSSITAVVVSSSYAVTSSTVVLSGLTLSASNVWWVSGWTALGSLSNDRFVVAGYNTSSQLTWVVCSNAGATLATGGGLSSRDPTAAVGLPGGGFAILASNGATSYLCCYSELSTNTFSLVSNFTDAYLNYSSGVASTGPAQGQLMVNAKGQLFAYPSVNSSGGYTSGPSRWTIADPSNSGLQVDVFDSSATANYPRLGCELSNGVFLSVEPASTATQFIYGSAYAASINSASVPATDSGAYQFLLSPLQGAKAVFVYTAMTSNVLKFALVTTPDTTASTVIANSTQSTAVTITSGTYFFTGVCANVAAAGTVGIVQTNGAAKLNSTYSASVPGTAFNARSTSTTGVSGVINGRSMVLYGMGMTGTT